METRGTQREANEAQEAPMGDQRGQEGHGRVTKGGQVGPIGPTRAPKGSKRGPRGLQGGTRGSQKAPRQRVPRGPRRRQKRPKGIPQSELDDSSTVSEGPEGGLKGQNLQKPKCFEYC